MIQFDHVTFQYEDAAQKALDDITLTIEDGAFVAVVGHNGSGKSTLAKHINGLLLPTSGSVTVNGMSTAEPDNILPIRQTVGIVFQNPDNQIVTTIIEEDVAFGPENLGVDPKEIRRRVDEALDTVGLKDYAERAIHQLSGGQKQRIAIAGMLALRPQILVMDEATAMLDPKGRASLIETLRKLHESGLTVVMVTQYMEEVVACDRVIVMRGGRIAGDGTPEAIFCNEALLESCSLAVPEAVRLANRLRGIGCTISHSALDTDSIAEELCRLL